MNPRLASPRLDDAAPDERAAPEVHHWRWFAVALFAVGLGSGVALLASGQRITGIGVFVVLAVVLGLAVNRYAFFPSELAVTAEVAVLLAAVVAFGIPAASGGAGGADGSLFGPWCLALLAGPLDVLHWRQRSFARMAYNAGNRMTATVLAALVFSAALGGDPSPSFVAIAVGALGASAAFALGEVVVGTVLVRLRTGDAWIAAVRVELPMESLTIPLGLVGALAGVLGADVGWWLAPMVLAPTIFVPELVLVSRRRPGVRLDAVATVVLAALAVVAPLALAPSPGLAEVTGLVAIAVLLGAELRADARAPVPALASLGVAAALVVGSDAAIGVAVASAVVVTAAAWVMERGSRWWAVPLAATAALVAVLIFDAGPSRATALVAAVVFQLVVWTRVDRVVWTAPLLCVAVTSAFAWRAIGTGGAVLFVGVLAVVLAATAAVGAPPWNSRLVAAWVARRHFRAHRAVLAAPAVAALACAIAAALVRSAADVLVPAASVCATAVAACAMNAVRQWRFAPARRTSDAAVVLVSALAAVLLYPRAGLDGHAWAVALVATALVACSAVAWPLVGRASAATTRPERDQARRVTHERFSAGPDR